jgi:hypothetical protein
VVRFVARAFQPEHIGDSDVRRGVLVCVECGPLTPDPSPPFHGGEGGKSGRWAVGLTRSREAAKGNAQQEWVGGWVGGGAGMCALDGMAAMV